MARLRPWALGGALLLLPHPQPAAAAGAAATPAAAAAAVDGTVACSKELLESGWCGVSLGLRGDELVWDSRCWNIHFTADICCAQAQSAAAKHGCWPEPGTAVPDGEESFNWDDCCSSFMIWRPPAEGSTLRRSYDVALRHILDPANNHPGMIFGRIAAELGYSRCAEVGVLSAVWSEWFLVYATAVDGRLERRATGEVRELTLIDVWQNQGTGNYHDDQATLSMVEQLKRAVSRLARFWPRVRFVQQQSVVAARLFDDGALDMIFLDARHDECAVLEDLEAWWPKLRKGGLLAGDDYLSAEAAQEFYGAQNDWSVCESGEVREGGVRGAVDRFAASLGLQVSYFRYYGATLSPQWLIFKP